MKNILIVILILGAASMWACSKDLPDAGGTTTEALSNEWWVSDKVTNIRKVTTYNTSPSQDSMWLLLTQKIDSVKRGDSFQVKVKSDPASLTFSTQNSRSLLRYSIDAVTITNGKIMHNAGISATGNVTDSIYFEAEYSNSPGVKHIFAGTARTRYDEDDY